MNGERPTAAFEENLLTWVADETDNQPIVTLRK
jgi:hypothetical protein